MKEDDKFLLSMTLVLPIPSFELFLEIVTLCFINEFISHSQTFVSLRNLEYTLQVIQAGFKKVLRHC